MKKNTVEAAGLIFGVLFFVWTASAANRLDCSPMHSIIGCSPRLFVVMATDVARAYRWIAKTQPETFSRCSPIVEVPQTTGTGCIVHSHGFARAYAFSRRAVTLKEFFADDAEVLRLLERTGEAGDTKCVLGVLGETELPDAWAAPRDNSVSYILDGERLKLNALYGEGDTPEDGVLRMLVDCEILEAIHEAESVSVEWEGKNGTVADSLDSITGFKKELARVLTEEAQ